MASEQDMVGALRQAHEAGDTEGAQRIADMIGSQRQATAPKVEPQSALMAGINAAGDTASFGLVKPLSARLASAISQFTSHPKSVAETSNTINASSEATAAAHPVATVVGDVAGMFTGSGALGTASKALETAPTIIGKGAKVVNAALSAKKGQPLLNIGRAAAPGAVIGGIQAEAAGEGVTPQAGMDVALGAAGSLAGNALAHGAGRLASNAAVRLSQGSAGLLQNKAVRLLAKTLDETPEDLSAAMTNFKGITGRNASMSDIMNMKSTGQLKHLAESRPAFGATVGEEVQSRATAPAQGVANPTTQGTLVTADTARSGELPSNEAVNTPTDINTLSTQRKQNMDIAMKPIRGVTVPVDASHADLLGDPRVRAAVRATKDPELRDSYSQALNDISPPPTTGQSGAQVGGTSNALTVSHLDSIRQSLRNEQANFANPQNSRHNSQAATSMGALADKIGDVASAVEPKYATALKQFTDDSNYIHGFKHGVAGKSQGEVAADSPVARALNTGDGQIGYNHGAAEARAKSNLDTIAPSSVKPETGPGAANAAHAAVGIAKGGAWGVYHVTRALQGLGLKASDSTLSTAARYLTDPKMAKQGINIMKKAGATDKDIARIAAAAGAIAGSKTSQLTEAGQ